jgi:hypothetical protein
MAKKDAGGTPHHEGPPAWSRGTEKNRGSTTKVPQAAGKSMDEVVPGSADILRRIKNGLVIGVVVIICIGLGAIAAFMLPPAAEERMFGE